MFSAGDLLNELSNDGARSQFEMYLKDQLMPVMVQCAKVRVYVHVCMCVCVGVHGCMRVCVGVHVCMRVCVGVHGCLLLLWSCPRKENASVR